MATEEVEILRPKRRVFIWRPVLRRGIFSVLLALLAHFFLPLFVGFDPGLLFWLFFALLFTVTRLISRAVAYSKTFYEFYEDRLIVKTGTLLSQNTVDLPFRNVTQVILRLPFWEHRFFSTGHLTVQTAGSRQGTAHLESVARPRKLYATLADCLRDNGFALSRSKKVQQEKPHIVGTFLDTSGVAIGGLIALITLGLSVGGAVIDLLNLQTFFDLFDVLVGTIDVEEVADTTQEATIAYRSVLGLAVVAVLGGIGGLIKIALHFVDLNRRTYTLWEDVVDYEDGFLTETKKFIPVENLADTSITEPFLKRLFGIANVQLSPHGAGGGIQFPSMPRAARFRDNLSRLIEESEGPTPTQALDPADLAERAASDESDESDQRAGADKLPLVGTRRSFGDEKSPPLSFRPSFFRGVFTALGKALKVSLLLVVIGATLYYGVPEAGLDLTEYDVPLDEIPFEWAAVGLGLIFATVLVVNLGRTAFFRFTTTFKVGRRKLTWERDFISRDEVEFTLDKITTMEVERDVIDRLIGTATFVFFSIGNAQPLIFEDVDDSHAREREIRRRLHLLAETPLKEHRPRVTPLDFLFQRAGSIFFALLFATAALVATNWWAPAGYLAPFFLALIPYRLIKDWLVFRHAKLAIFEDHFFFQRGILRRHYHFIAFEQARSIETTRYPGRTSGTLRVVPGSDRAVSLPYLRQVDKLHERFDDKLYAFPMRPVRQQEELDRLPVSRRRPMARNAIVVTSLVLSLTIVGIPFALLVALWLYFSARRTTIVVEEGRLRTLSGIAYRTTHSVVANRIDQLVLRRGALNTLFNNGYVQVLTVGSSTPELTLGPVADEKALYNELEARVPGR